MIQLSFSLLFCVFLLGFLPEAQAVPDYDVQCENESDCPGWMAGLAHGQGVCSTFMVTDTIMGTNLHCIPEDLRSDNRSCKDRIRIFFPKTAAFQKETAECETILYTSPPLVANFLTPDFAFFKVSKPVSREALSLSQNGMADMSEMTVYKVDPTAGKAKGTIRKVLCTAVQNSMLNPFFNSDLSPLITLMPCHTIPGNSGSPILGSDGNVRGILSAMTPNVSIVADKDVKAGMAKGGVTLGANFSCLNTYFLGRNKGDPTDCKVKSDTKTRELMFQKIVSKTMGEVQKSLQEKLNTSAMKLVAGTKRTVRWSLKKSEPTEQEEKDKIVGTFTLQPECLVPFPGSPEELQNKLKKSDVSLPVSWTKYQVRLDHDGYYRPKAKLEEETVQAAFIFKPVDFLKNKDIPVRLEKARAPAAVEAPVVLEKYSVNLCQPRD